MNTKNSVECGWKFVLPAVKHCWKLNCQRAICDGLLARLEVLVGRLADPWCRCYSWVRQLLGYRGSDTVLAIRNG